MEPGAPLLHAAVPGNLCFDFEYGDAAAAEAAFRGAAHVVRPRQDSGRVVGNPMEPKAVIAAWDGDVLDLWSGSQGVTGMRDGVAGLTGLALLDATAGEADWDGFEARHAVAARR